MASQYACQKIRADLILKGETGSGTQLCMLSFSLHLAKTLTEEGVAFLVLECAESTILALLLNLPESK